MDDARHADRDENLRVSANECGDHVLQMEEGGDGQKGPVGSPAQVCGVADAGPPQHQEQHCRDDQVDAEQPPLGVAALGSPRPEPEQEPGESGEPIASRARTDARIG